jgi:arylsulfatase A-like enzyme
MKKNQAYFIHTYLRQRSHQMVIWMLCGILMLGSTSFKTTTDVSKPNIIVILIDDAGYADFGFMGSKDLLTPRLDELAKKSVRLTDAHVSASVCSPSRAGLLTGRYQQRFGYECNEGDGYIGIDISQTLLPKRLVTAGYTTAAFGKWHLGFKPEQHPLSNGFQYYYGFLSGGRSYFYKPDKDDRPGVPTALLENRKQVAFEGYLTDVLGDKAADFIHENKSKPFFMYWAPNAVHTPLDADQKDLDKFPNHPRKKLAAMTFALDRAVGKLLDALQQDQLLDNTLIFFLSDNGGAHNNQSDNFPLKGFKGNKYEAGHRVPFLVHWPAKWKGGNNFAGLSSALDIFPTALDAARIKNDASAGLDGVSLIPFLTGTKKGSPHGELVWRKDGAAAIRKGNYKLIQFRGLEDRLYDLSSDLGETHDLKSTKPDVYRDLKARFTLWEKDKMKPIWTEGALWDSITLMIHDDLMNNRKVRVRNPEELERFRSTKNK